MIEEARKRLVFALDVETLEEACRWVESLKEQVGLFKVGKQLFTRCGPEVVRVIQQSGGEVFLDLKYHDIPNTVAKAGIEAARLGVKIFNVHALGGFEMMKRTVDEIDQLYPQGSAERPILLAVTILTSSTDETLQRIGLERPVREMVPRLAQLAQQAGMDGVVASPQEVPLVRNVCGADFLTLTPGVRPDFASLDDQKRVMTPAEAIAAGSDYLVVGRPIAHAEQPQEAARLILNEMAAALETRF